MSWYLSHVVELDELPIEGKHSALRSLRCWDTGHPNFASEIRADLRRVSFFLFAGSQSNSHYDFMLYRVVNAHACHYPVSSYSALVKKRSATQSSNFPIAYTLKILDSMIIWAHQVAHMRKPQPPILQPSRPGNEKVTSFTLPSRDGQVRGISSHKSSQTTDYLSQLQYSDRSWIETMILSILMIEEYIASSYRSIYKLFPSENHCQILIVSYNFLTWKRLGSLDQSVSQVKSKLTSFVHLCWRAPIDSGHFCTFQCSLLISAETRAKWHQLYIIR